MPVPKFQPKVKQIRRKNLQPESKMQESCFTWFHYQYPEYYNLYFSIPNGGKRDIQTAVTMKKEGLKDGVLDTFLAVSRHGFHGLFVEFKWNKNQLTQNQIEFKEAVDNQGYATAVCYTLESFISLITNYLGDGKERNQPNYRVHLGEH